MSRMTTERDLREWRHGQTQAERLCAGLLSIEDFSSIDPQHPLGGPDGIKDVLCRKGAVTYVAAAYFPSTTATFPTIRRKFLSDMEGASASSTDGFIFITNQFLTVGERADLQKATGADLIVELYHLERMRAVLDSPKGYGLRLEYLRIPMQLEEQVAYFSSFSSDIVPSLNRIQAMQAEVMARLDAKTAEVLAHTTMRFDDLSGQIEATTTPQPFMASLRNAPFATARLDVAILCWLHRLLMSDSTLPEALRGNLRKQEVSIRVGSTVDPAYVPPSHTAVPPLINTWCREWRDGYEIIRQGETESKIKAVSQAFYDFLAIHPFADGNGRLANLLLDQFLRELFSRSLSRDFVAAKADLQNALRAANGGDMTSLEALIGAAIL